jgi:hypothetical protein
MKSMQKHCAYWMHKVHKDHKNVEQRRDGGCCREESHMGKWMLWAGAEIHRRGVIQRIKIRRRA